MINVNTYVDLAIESNIQIEKEYQNMIESFMEAEEGFYMSCLEMGEIVLEKMEVEEHEVTSKKNFFERMIDAILMIFNSFTEKVKVIMD